MLCKTQTLALDVLGDHRGVLLLEVGVEHLAELLLGRFEELLILPRTCLAGAVRALRQQPGPASRLAGSAALGWGVEEQSRP